MYALSCAGVMVPGSAALLAKISRVFGWACAFATSAASLSIDFLRRFRRREQRGVEAHVEAGQGFRDRRHFRDLREALAERGAEHHQLARPWRAASTPGMVPKASAVSPESTEAIAGTVPLYGTCTRSMPGHLLQALDREMRDRAVARGAVGHLARVGFHHLDELRHRARVEVRARHQHHRRAGDDRDRLEVVQHVVGQLGVERGADRVARHVGRRPACSRRPRSSPPPRGRACRRRPAGSRPRTAGRSIRSSPCTTARVSTSLTPAGGHGTTTRTGLAG